MPQHFWVLYLTAPSQKSVWSPRSYYPWNKITSSIWNNYQTTSKADWSTGSLVAREEGPKLGDNLHLQNNAFRPKPEFVDLIYEMTQKQNFSFPYHFFFLPSSFLLIYLFSLSYFLIALFISYSSLSFFFASHSFSSSSLYSFSFSPFALFSPLSHLISVFLFSSFSSFATSTILTHIIVSLEFEE